VWPASDRKSLERFLLKAELESTTPNSPAIPLNSKSSRIDEQNNDEKLPELTPESIADAQVDITLMPMADKAWLPEPLLYKQLDYAADYLQALEALETRLGVRFAALLIYFVAFLQDASAFAPGHDAPLLCPRTGQIRS
jgi:hypothetical protein